MCWLTPQFPFLAEENRANQAITAINYFITYLPHTNFIRLSMFSFGFGENVSTGAFPSHLNEMEYT